MLSLLLCDLGVWMGQMGRERGEGVQGSAMTRGREKKWRGMKNCGGACCAPAVGALSLLLCGWLEVSEE